MKKLKEIIRLMFPVAAKRFPLFFPLEALKTLCDILMPFIAIFVTPLIIDELVGGKDLTRLYVYAAILILGECLLTVIRQLSVNQLGKYKERLDNYFTQLISEHAMGLDYQLTEDKKLLDQLEKTNTGMSWYSEGVYGISEQIFTFVGNAIKIVGLVTVIALHAPLLLAVILLCVCLNAFLMRLSSKVELKAFERLSKVNRMFGYYGWEMVDFRYGKDIRLYDASGMLLNKWDGFSEESFQGWKWQADTTRKYALIQAALSVFQTAFTYGYTALKTIGGVFSLGIFTQMVSAAESLFNTLGGIASNITELLKKANYAYEYVIFMNYPQAMPKGDKPVPTGEHRIEFRNVSFAYPGTEKKVLDGVNLTVEKGERLSIVGLNGAGKTTLIKLLCRLYDPTDGQILLDGTDIREYDYDQYMQQFSPVFQDFRLFGFTVSENVTLKDRENMDEKDRLRVSDLLKQAGLEKFADKLESGEDAKLFKYMEEDGIEPSGGEQQKMALARALYKDAPVIILDEPTAALDPVAEYEIYKQFNSLIQDKTAFYISHRLSSCRFCDHIAVFSEGRVAEYGTHDDLVNIPDGLYAAMFEAQAQYYR
ncbi:MAG: ABC transporter ATP-binding protein [Clostridia bacterium]|nr:ABC transporter ATP-binding protein [Clostridia bacterium]